jgi:hypothetical protein
VVSTGAEVAPGSSSASAAVGSAAETHVAPLGQGAHAAEEDAPVERLYVPAPQAVGALLPVPAQKEPCGHRVGAAAPPAGQKAPAGQVVGADMPLRGQKEPVGQGAQEALPGAEL